MDEVRKENAKVEEENKKKEKDNKGGKGGGGGEGSGKKKGGDNEGGEKGGKKEPDNKPKVESCLNSNSVVAAAVLSSIYVTPVESFLQSYDLQHGSILEGIATANFSKMYAYRFLVESLLVQCLVQSARPYSCFGP